MFVNTGVISDFRIFCQSFINENFHNSTTSRDIGHETWTSN